MVINYESVSRIIDNKGKIVFSNLDGTNLVNMDIVDKDFDFIILDEAHHAISSVGRTSKTWKAVYKIAKNKPILYLSATPYAEHIGLIYPQLKLSKWTPLKDKNFYDFFREYGIPSFTRTPTGLQETYKKYETEKVLKKIIHLFSFKTRAEVGIKHEPTVKVIKVPMNVHTKRMIAEWTTNRVLLFADYTFVNEQPIRQEYEIIGDSDPKLRAVHYQLEGGTIKIDDQTSVFLPECTEKIDYIKANYEEKKIAIMAHFIKERELLKKELPYATILSSDGDAEGIDLHRTEKLIIYSMSFKTSKHTQRTARQANNNRETPIEVDILVMDKPAIGMDVYKSVAIKKENFVKNSYERSVL